MDRTVLLESVYPEARFGGFSRVDGTVAFYTRVRALLDPSHVVLDVGCGRGKSEDDPSPTRRQLQNLRGDVATVIGIDVDERAAGNPKVDEFRPIEALDRWPVGDGSVDVIVSDYVLEHVADPEGYLSEAHRVLRPGGMLCARTPNKLGYVALVAQAVPNRLHARVVGTAQAARAEHDVFPTVYKMNRRGSLLRQLEAHGFDGEVVRHESEPSYLAFSPLAYRLGALVHRALPGPLKNQLFVFARRRR
ncbi:class I SAM-dependent methyltransferase [Rubrivirga sp. IMCC45206]|uniref:class I SAM-dependent methyltransferase n=1 Tax=Rubrivirga sp. IMCC45206 TaxID=3391614 RepID=UPI0039900742